MSPDLGERLEHLGQLLRDLEHERSRIMSQLTAAIREADHAGMPRSEIVRRAGVARQTVYRALARE